jgi:EthD protein.
MISYFVRYHGKAADPIAFARYYETAHASILQRFPGIHSLILHQPVTWSDPFPVRDDGTSLLAQMTFETAADLDRALHRMRGARHAMISRVFRASMATSPIRP